MVIYNHCSFLLWSRCSCYFINIFL